MGSKNFVSRLVLFIVLLIGLNLDAQQQTIVQNVQRSYRTINDATISYTQILHFPLTRHEQRFEGRVYMKKPNNYRIESEQQIIITDGNTIWSYNPFTEQVIIDLFKEEEQAFTPDRFLLTIPDEFFVSVGEREVIEGKSYATLRLIPKDDHQFIRSMRMWIDESNWLVKRAEIIDLNDTRSVYTVDEIKINTGLESALFKYTPPPDVEVIDLR